MKKYCIYLLGLLAVLAASCTVEQPAEVILSGDGYTAVIEAPAATRTVADENLHVLWSKGDQLSIFDQSTWNGQYELKGEGGTNTGEFKKIERTDYHAGMELPYVYAVYPYNEANNVSNEGVISVTLPATQTYAPNSFGPGAATMASIAVGKELKFKNLCGFFSVKLYGNAKVKSITIKGVKNEPIAGAATITAPEEGVIPVLAMAATATKEITLTCAEPVQLGTTEETATTFWIAVPPTEFTSGVTVTVINDKDETFEKTSNAVTIVRNTKTDTAPLLAFDKAMKPMFAKFSHMTMRVGKKVKNVVWYGTADDYAHKSDDFDPIWTSLDPAIASVNQDGEIEANAVGETGIKVEDGQGNYITIPVKVIPTTPTTEYNYGVSVMDLSRIDAGGGDNYYDYLKLKSSQFELMDGYVEGTQRMGAKISEYRFIESSFSRHKVDASKIQNPALFIRIYISDPTKLKLSSSNVGEIELRSNGLSVYEDSDEICWPIHTWCADAEGAEPDAKQHLVAGWNNIVLPFSLGKQGHVPGTFDPSKISFFRFYQGTSGPYEEVTIKFDQVRIVDWTEFESCDNFDVWYDGGTDNNRFIYELDTTNQHEGSACFSATDDLRTSNVSVFRLKMSMAPWQYREYSLPYDMTEDNAQISFWFWVDDAEYFNKQTYTLEISCNGKNDAGENWRWTILPADNHFVNGWNKITKDFSSANKGDGRNVHKINYLRVVIETANPQCAHTYKIDDFRITKK